MADKVLLISEQTLKKYTLINDNVDGAYILPAITMSQDLELDNLIGSVLNNKLQDLVRTGAITGATDYKLLLDEYITPYLAWQSMAAIQTFVNYKLSNSGVISNEDERKAKLDYNNAKSLQTQYERYASSYADKITNYLLRNTTKYPEYTKSENYQYAMDAQLCDIYLSDIPVKRMIWNYKYK